MIDRVLDSVSDFLLNTQRETVQDITLIRVESTRTAERMAIQVVRAQSMVVHDEASCALAESYVKEIKAEATALEAKRDEWCEPLKKSIDLARKDVKPRLDVAKQIEEILKQKCINYRSEIAAIRARAEAEAQRALAEHKPQEAQAAFVVAASATAPKTTGVHYTKVKIATVVNPAILPEKYWTRSYSQTLIDLDVANGVTEIPGVTIVETERMSASKKG